MARPRQNNPTPAELEILQMIWEHGPCTVRDVMNLLSPERQRAYTSIMSLMNVMTEKGFLESEPQGRAFIYSAKISQKKAQTGMLKDLLSRAFDNSASTLMVHLLEQSNSEELDEIQKKIKEFSKKRENTL